MKRIPLSAIDALVDEFRDIEEFAKEIESIPKSSLPVNAGDGSNISVMLQLIFGEDPQENKDAKREVAKAFLSKVDISTASQEEHFILFQGLANLRKINEIACALERGFDPGALNNLGYNALQTPAEQTQLIGESAPTQESLAEAMPNRKIDAAVIKMFLTTGKINGFEGDKGREEAVRIESNVEKMNFCYPDEYSAKTRDYFKRFHNRRNENHVLDLKEVAIGDASAYIFETTLSKELVDRMREQRAALSNMVFGEEKSDEERLDEERLDEERLEVLAPGSSPERSFIEKMVNFLCCQGWS